MSEKHWHVLDPEAAVRELGADISAGLGEDEAARRLQQFGANKLTERPGRSLLSMFLDQIRETLVLILLVAVAISAFLGEWPDAIVILIIVVLNASLGVFQENKAEQSLKALQAMTKTMVKVVRGGQVMEKEKEDLVPGDLVLLEAGDSIPADIRLLEVHSFQVEEASLTGESVPVEKDPAALEGADLTLGDRKNMAYMGTTVTAGRGRGLVAATGMRTELGRIAQLLQDSPLEQTPLQRQLAGLGKVLGMVAAAIVAVVFVVGLLRGGDLMEMFLTAIALAVAAVPEGLPSVVTIVLAIGVTRMSRRNAVIRKLPAVETLGVADFICTDKTGTLTKNQMTVVGLYSRGEKIAVSGGGYEPKGEFTDAAGKAVDPLQDDASHLMLLGGLLNCDARLNSTDQGYQVIGDPTEAALMVAAVKAGLSLETAVREYPRIEEIPFDSGRKLMTTFHSREGMIYSFTKGAPDVLLGRCSQIIAPDGTLPLDRETAEKTAAVNAGWAGEGQRVLGIAFRKWSALPEEMAPAAVENDLIFLGFFAIQDPPREEVKAAVASGRSAGIRTVMITGDHQDTAMAIARDLDIWRPGDKVLTGSQLQGASQAEMEKIVEETTVYARVSPENKLQIVEALKARGHVVAMTGDGVNDAPALKRADIGAAMGITGTAVSKEAADMVLLDDNFATIIAAVEEGRTIYSNIRKSIQYLLSCNAGEVVAIFLAILLGMGSPLTPIQILWMNLVTDGPPALALGLEPPEGGIMKRKPRSSREGIFSGGVGVDILFQGTCIGLVSFAAYVITLSGGSSPVYAHTVTFMTMAMSQLFHAFNARSLEQSVFTTGIRSNPSLIYAFLLSFALLLMVVLLPPLQGVFETTSISLGSWETILGLSLVPVLLSEIRKALRRRG